MESNTTLFMTPGETERVQSLVLNLIKQRHDQARLPRGQTDHVSVIQQAISTALMRDISSAAFGLGATKTNENKMAVYPVGDTYLPCTTSLEHLQPMELSDLHMETNHRGRVLSLRRVSPVVDLKTSPWAVMQGDSVHQAERLEVFLHKSRSGGNVLDMCSEILVKEPFYTMNLQGETVIRVDHPSDLVITSWSNGPESWRHRSDGPHVTEAGDASACKEQGNKALDNKKLNKAHMHYTKGLELISEDDETLASNLFRNRAHVNLQLGRFDEALSDALSSMKCCNEDSHGEIQAKAYYRAGLAAYELGDFQAAKTYFEEQEKIQPGNRYAEFSLKKARSRLHEQEAGIFDLERAIRYS